jgi:hypothetical protein
MRLTNFLSAQQVESSSNQLRKTARQWSPHIRRSLDEFGQARWPQQGWRHWLPVRSFRLREELDGSRYIWWIERDIPPVDLYRCAAYQVVLSVDRWGVTNLTLRTGLKDYPIPQPRLASLELVLAGAAQDPALVIPRRMGAAYD